ncbi:MAG TPA: DUF1501 domain-containing protein [Gemmataceae bacterium]|nr:DUF1501 domain-containing protein [Gemmataceae bacterium]
MFARSSLPRLSRRDWLRLSSAGVVGFSLSGWIERLAAETATHPSRRRSCILLWMNGGPSQMDTWDLKPGHANGGPYKEIATSVPGIKIGEHLPKMAKHMDKMVLVRSMSTKEGDHDRASYYLRTGYRPGGPIQYPAIGASLSKELGSDDSELPNFVSIAPNRFINPAAYGSGFLGPRYAPLVVGDNAFGGNGQNYDQALKVQDLLPPRDLGKEEVDARLDLFHGLERDFVTRHAGVPGHSHLAAYERAVRLMRGEGAKAFELTQEDPKVRESYGKNLFGQGCLLARRLVERGVPFVEVTLGSIQEVPEGWDTHQNNFDHVAKLCQVLDTAWSALLDDLKRRGLLDSTLIVWMGEFGRTPRINPQKGRDHFPNAWSTVLAGGGIKGGQVVGKTSPDGMSVAEHTVTVPDLLATVSHALGVDPRKQNPSNVGRPIRIADPAAKVLTEVVA